MKKAILLSFFGSLFFSSCAQNKEKREEYKENHNKDSIINKMGDSAVAHSETTSPTKIDSTKTK